MQHANELKVLRRLLVATRDRKITWAKDEDDWYSTRLGDAAYSVIAFRFRYIEAPPQIGADPYILELMMPGLNAVFTAGTEGYDLLFCIYSEATGSGPPNDGSDAVAFLDRNGI